MTWMQRSLREITWMQRSRLYAEINKALIVYAENFRYVNFVCGVALYSRRVRDSVVSSIYNECEIEGAIRTANVHGRFDHGVCLKLYALWLC